MEDNINIEETLKTVENTTILCLLKAGQKEHLEHLRKGTLFCRSLNYYKSSEHTSKPFHDKNEGVMSVLQSDKISIVLKSKDIGEVTLDTKTGLTGQVILSVDQNTPAFCMHAIHSGTWTTRPLTVDTIADFKTYLNTPLTTMNKHGDYVWVITDYAKFAERLHLTCTSKNLFYRQGLVRYINFEKSHGQIPSKHLGFVKDVAYEQEREYRYCFYSANELPDPFVLNIGSLEDISIVISFEEFIHSWSIEIPSD